MDFMKALELVVSVIKEQGSGLDEIYLYERNSQTQIYLKDCEGSLAFERDWSLPEQIYLASCLDKRMRSISLSLNVIFSTSWEVRLRKNQHLKATRRSVVGKAGDNNEVVFLDYTPVGREVADV